MNIIIKIVWLLSFLVFLKARSTLEMISELSMFEYLTVKLFKSMLNDRIYYLWNADGNVIGNQLQDIHPPPSTSIPTMDLINSPKPSFRPSYYPTNSPTFVETTFPTESPTFESSTNINIPENDSTESPTSVPIVDPNPNDNLINKSNTNSFQKYRTVVMGAFLGSIGVFFVSLIVYQIKGMQSKQNKPTGKTTFTSSDDIQHFLNSPDAKLIIPKRDAHVRMITADSMVPTSSCEYEESLIIRMDPFHHSNDSETITVVHTDIRIASRSPFIFSNIVSHLFAVRVKEDQVDNQDCSEVLNQERAQTD